MFDSNRFSRRNFLKTTSLAAAGAAGGAFRLPRSFAFEAGALTEFGYGDVTIFSELHERQFNDTHAILMELSEDSLLKPFRQMAGQPAPGQDLGGWYNYDPDYEVHHQDAGFAPGATFGQWVSALARAYAINGSPAVREKVLRLNRLYAKTISGDFYDNNKFPAYCYDKLVLALIDSQRLIQDPDAFAILERTTDAALPHLPGKAIDREMEWRPGKPQSYRWDESYTMPENLFLAHQFGAGKRYRDLAVQYLDDKTFFDPLSRDENVLEGKHAYSYVNALSSSMQAYMVGGSEKHLRASKNAFRMVMEQSFATGGWGPDEMLQGPDGNKVYESLNKTHNSFETPCGSYAHFKVSRYLLRVTRDSKYGDSMERVMYNTVLGAKGMQLDGHAFYYSDYNFGGKKVFSNHIWPCCSGTLPQVAADYRINTYFHDGAGVFVNLFIPSAVRWTKAGSQFTLSQQSAYPFENTIQFELKSSRPAEFSLRFRTPRWAEEASLRVNGKRSPAAITPGAFASIRREWKSGDRVELELPMKMRLEAIDVRHSDVVALMRGPLVLFPIAGVERQVSREQLLAAANSGEQEWSVQTRNGDFKLKPFTAIHDESYSTYLRVS